MTKEDVFKKLSGVTNIPTLPIIMHKLGQLLRSQTSSAADVENLISDDPAMMARILKVVNSAAYSPREPIHSVQQAVAIMGMNAVHNMALSTAVFGMHKGDDKSVFSREEFWRHCISVGIAATVLHDRTQHALTKTIPRDVLHVAALVHDIGKIIFQEHFHDEFLVAVRRSRDKQMPLHEAEQEVIGTTHAEVGAWLTERWKLSDQICQAVRWHHDPYYADVEHIDLIRLCHTANHICNVQQLGFSGNAGSTFKIGVWRTLGLRVRDVADIVAETNAHAEDSEALIAIAIGS